MNGGRRWEPFAIGPAEYQELMAERSKRTASRSWTLRPG